MKGWTNQRRGAEGWPLDELRLLDHSDGVTVYGVEGRLKERGIEFRVQLDLDDVEQIVLWQCRRSKAHFNRIMNLMHQLYAEEFAKPKRSLE